MAKLSGARLLFGVLVGADKTDESLGVVQPASADRPTRTVDESPRSSWTI